MPTPRVTAVSDTSLLAHSQFAVTGWSSKMSYRPDPLTAHEYSEDEKDKITRVVHSVLYRGMNIQLEDVRKKITFTTTFLSIDDNLKPTTAFASFWFPGMIVAPYVVIFTPTPDPERWGECSHELRPMEMQEFAFKFTHLRSRMFAMYPPTHVWYEGALRCFRSYTLLRGTLDCRMMDLQMDLESLTEAEKQANPIRWNFFRCAMEALELALASVEEEKSSGWLMP